MRKLLPVIIIGIIVLIIDIAIEFLILPTFYKGIPTPFPTTEKPVGSILLPVTFFHLLLALPSLLIILFIAEKIGYKKNLMPKDMHGWVEIAFLLVLFLSGMLMWWFPLAVLPFLIAGAYLVLVEIR